jgi:hypothetical protein
MGHLEEYLNDCSDPAVPSSFYTAEAVILNFYGAQKLIQGIDSASLCSLAGRYENPIPTWFLAPLDCSKIPAQPYRRRNNWSLAL